MTTAPNLNFSISARYLGPVFSLDGELTNKAQNLVFARNGTGKSFLSRAFRYLDIYGQGATLENAPRDLVSDEAPDDKGAFSFSRGAIEMGSLQLEKLGDKTKAQLHETIFHVFSEDFVQEELREQEYKLDGEIENQISVDSANIQRKDAEEALFKAVNTAQSAFDNLKANFEKEKVAQLIDKAGVRKQLKEFGALSFEGLLSTYSEKPAAPEKSFAEILKDLDGLRSIPAEPVYPQAADAVQLDEINLRNLAESLDKVTSPSSVSEKVKQKIDAHLDFYNTGVDIIDREHRASCPFCEQGITDPDPKAVIDAYVDYFSDEEARHKSELRGFFAALNAKEKQLTDTENQLARQKTRYDTLKAFLPSMKETSLAVSEEAVKAAAAAIFSLKSTIEDKAKGLGVPASLPDDDLAACVGAVNQIIEDNNKSVETLSRAVAKSDDERKKLQRQACASFEREFAAFRWLDIEALRALQTEKRGKAAALTALEKLSPSTDARVRVADTFEMLLKEFFGDKYVFDKETFVLKRGTHEMTRGPHRTLSDGEKTAIAFCYFLACVHLKVTANSDYQRLFFVFDDPVTSMSYDFVFTIAQTLKNLNISDQGEVSINPGLINVNKCKRPELLILTHSSYFFNISVSNRVAKENAAFALHPDKGVHKLARLNKYVAPFQEQLKDIFEITNGRDPDHSTANAIRSVLEAIGRFCRPDKSASLTEFVQHLAAEDGILVKSVLINSLCHGTYYEEMPLPDDLKLACAETMQVVKKYAPGQLEVIKGILAAK